MFIGNNLYAFNNFNYDLSAFSLLNNTDNISSFDNFSNITLNENISEFGVFNNYFSNDSFKNLLLFSIPKFDLSNTLNLNKSDSKLLSFNWTGNSTHLISNEIRPQNTQQNITPICTTSTSTVSSRSTTRTAQVTSKNWYNETGNIKWWTDLGYNPAKGNRLCAATKVHLDNNPRINGKRKITGQCVGFVRKGINDAFYNGEQHYTTFGKAHLCGETYLSKDKNFKKLTGIDLSRMNPADIPAGCVVLYYPGYSNSAASQVCGHGEVSNGQGMGYSDCLTYLKNNNKQRIKEIWIPV